jgi:murein DD-endopeptidase MepM/ murein hydrolase activator NlpD
MSLRNPHSDDKVRIIFFSTSQSSLRHFEFNLKKAILIFFFTAFVTGGLFMASATISNSLDRAEGQVDLQRSNDYLENQVSKLQENIDQLNDKLSDLEGYNEDLEVLMNLSGTESIRRGHVDQPVTASSRDIGKMLTSAAPVDFEYNTYEMNQYLDRLETRIRQAETVQGTIEDRFLTRDKPIKNVPSIRPVLDGAITDRFGKRKDPFVSRVKHHNGIDLKARYGTKVYAAASGTIEFRRVNYRRNVGYGKVVIINHGLGYKTLYGHLSKVRVKAGQKVNRWDVIGQSGNTGRATGPHLHYEVWKDGRSQNPEGYILN